MAVQINVAANQAALTASIQAGVQAYNQRFAQNNPINLSINQRAFSQPLGRMTGDVKDFEAALAASNARVIAFGASTAVLGGVIRSFKELANVTIEVEKNLADINRVFGLTTSQLQKFSTDLFNVTKQTASSFNDASQAALEFSRQGLKAEETLQRTKDALTLTRLAGISTANAVDALTSTVNGFAATGITTSQILNKLVAVEQDFAVGAGDLAEALSRTGQAAQEAGVSLDQLNALVTSAQQSTARGGAVIGNALKTIFTRLQRTDTLDQLEAFNISVRDVQGNILPAVNILQNFAGAYTNLADAQRAQLSEQVAGVYQVNILKAIVNDLNKSQGVYAGALQRGASATNEAEVATAKLNQTLDALLKQTATSTQQLANNIGKVTFEPLARYGTEQLKSLVESMNEILEGEGIGSTFANGLLKGIRNVIAGPGAIAAFFTLFKLIQNSFTYLSQALPQIAGITTETQNRKNIEQSILAIMQQQGPVSQALAGTMGNQAAQAQILLQLARQQTAEYQIQSTLAKQLATQLAGQGVRVKGSGGLQVTRAGGYIPNATRMAEVVGAQAGGYTPGRVVGSPVGGVMNTAEDVKYVPGFAQPFINPPAGSKAGRAHRQNAINRTGIDPYALYGGFIPNFAGKKPSQFDIGRDFENTVGFDIGVFPAYNAAIDFNKVITKPVEKNYNPKLYKANSFADAHAGYGHKSSENISKVINHLDENYYSYFPKQGLKTKRLKVDDKSSLISKPDLLGDLFIRPYYTEIIGAGYDEAAKIQTSSISSLNTTAQATLLNGVSDKDKTSILNKKIKMLFAQDRVYGSGFIPNFAIPVDSARIPWFKKYASSYRNIASDKDVFRQIDFPTYGKGLDHNYAKVGNADMVSFLYEDFVRSAINIALGSKQVVRSKEAGFKNTPTNAISNRDPIDLAQKISGAKFRMLEVKQSKNNQKDTISQISDAKLRGLFQENPELAKNVELMSIIFNDPRYVDPTGKNPAGVLSPFEQSIAPIVKNSYADVDPTMRGKLGLLTDGLMKRYQSKKNLFSKGFIPNFAYKQAVMGLEESMSGNKAIFDTKPFPHIRNSSQPTFSSAISDHGGLSNALSDSMRGQKAAGLMSGGFIPNFADSSINVRSLLSNAPKSWSASIDKAQNALMQLADELLKNKTKVSQYSTELAKVAANNKVLNSILPQLEKQLIQEVNEKKKSILNQKLSSVGTTLAFAGPMAAGLIEQSVFGNRQRTDMSATERQVQSGLSTGLTAISTGASIGSAFGPWGAAIGVAAGAAIGLAQSLGAASLSADELRQVADEYKSKTQENISSAQNYIDTLKILNTSTDPDIIKKASESLAENFSNIKDVNLQEIFEKTGTDVKKLGDALNEYEKDRKKMQNEADEDTKAALGTKASKAKQLSELGYNKSKTVKGPGLVSDTTYLEFSKENDKKILSDFKQTFDDLSVLTEEKAAAFQKLITDEKLSVSFDTEKVASFLKESGISEGISQRLANRFDELEEDGNLIGDYLINGLARLLEDSKRKIKNEESNKIKSDNLINDFISLKRQLTLTLSDSLIKASDAIKKYEFDTSIVNLISGKMKEINDSLYSSISGNLSDAAGISVKSAQLNYSNLFQTSELSKGREQLQQSTSLKRIQNRTSYEQQAEQTIFGVEGITRNAQTMNLIKKFISDPLSKSRPEFETFAGKLGISAEKALDLAKALETNQKSFSDSNQALQEAFNFKTQEFELTETANKINYQTSLEQLKLETEKLKITYAQRDATLQLRKDVESYKITSAQSLELKKIDIGSEFRYLGLGKRETFASQQIDQKAIFDEEQKIAQTQAILDARRSIIEIASQEANTAAQDANTNAVLELIDAIATSKIIEGENIMSSNTATQEDIDRGGRIQDQGNEIRARNVSLRKAFNERKNTLSYNQLNNLGVTNEMSIKEAIDKLESSKVGKDKTTINAIDNTIQDLANASDALGSNATIYAAKVAQAKSDFEQSAGFVNNMVIGFNSLGNQADVMLDQLGRNLPSMFADGLVDGIKAAIRESDNLGEALMGIAAKFLDEISTTLMRSSVYQILGSMGIGSSIPIQKQRGGVIRAQSGMYISGSGSGDKYPAMLENGEYVLNRKAVMAMGGPAELDKLNFSMAPRFASGGSFSNKFEDISSMESNMTTFGLEESKLYNELRDQKRQEAEAARQRKRARRQQMAGIIGSLAGAAVTLGLSAGIKKLNQTPKVDGGYAATSAGQLEIGASGDAGPSAEGLSIVQNQAVFATSRPKFGGRQVGGSIGSRLSDTIPGYATGGVFETPIVKRYALGGQTAGIGFGGTAGNSSTVNNNTNANNSFSFNTTVQRDGKIQVGANTTSYAQQDVELSQNLNNKVYEVILDTIRKEKRFGGSLAGVRN